MEGVPSSQGGKAHSRRVCCEENVMRLALALYRPHILTNMFTNNLFKQILMSRLPRDFLFIPAVASSFTGTTCITSLHLFHPSRLLRRSCLLRTLRLWLISF